MCHDRFRHFYPILCGVVAAAVVALGTVETVQASCGDYLADAVHAAPMPVINLLWATDNNARSDFQPAVLRPVGPRDLPCSGPACRNIPDLPAPPAPTPSLGHGEKQSCLPADGELLPPPSANDRPPAEKQRKHFGFRQRVERPPRLQMSIL
jgi:hypothetical protein